jgi:cell wall-associated NlpC family hydrolase
MINLSRRPPGGIRALAAAAAFAVSASLGTGPVWAAGGSAPGPTTTAPTESSLQVQAQELAAQIQADGRELDKMAEAYDSAQIRSAQLTSQIVTLQAESAQTAQAAQAAKAALKQQAVLSYVVGGAPVVGSVPRDSIQEHEIALSYAEIVSGGQKRAIDAYHRVMATEAEESHQLSSAQHDAAVTLSTLSSDRAAADQADTARRQALAQVNGQLAVLVAEVQAQQVAAAREAALATQQRRAPATTTPKPSSAPGVVTPSPTPKTSPPSSGPTSTAAPAGGTGGSGSSGGSGGSGNPSAQAPGASKAVAYANAQLGKPYQWGGAGPNSFDCSGLVMMAWEQAGIYFPHLAQDQYNLTQQIPLSSALPGDLIFFGTPSNVYHVGIYIGNGQMIDAPRTGENVSVSSIYWSDLLGAGRVTTSS